MYIALDIGGTRTRIAMSPSLSEPRMLSVHRFETQNNYDRDIDQIVQHIRSLAGDSPVAGIGCSFAGIISETRDTILASPNVPDWIGKPFAQHLNRAFRCQVQLANDAVCAALSEATYGLGKERDFLFLIWGTGVGGAAVRHLGHNVVVEPMEPGHSIVVWDNGRVCGCGQKGCVEAYIGGANIAKYMGKPAHELTEVEWEYVYEYLVRGLIDMLTVRHQSLVIFGGGVAIHQRARLFKLEEMVRSRMKIYPTPTILVTHHGDDAGLLGGFALLAS